MTTARALLPGVLAEIADVAGEDAARAILDEHAGQRIYLPAAPRPDHWLCALIGHDQAVAVCDRLTAGVAHIVIEIPLADRGTARQLQARIDQMIREGKSESDIVRATRVSVRTVRRRRARIRDDRQHVLF
ncbi:hypothetical protein [Sphingobium lignivorans]|uniref:Helix-turn-helix domain-containing protein n=1 Tax=Sphingobium lignivorans TaxID=2735886 RepID=A0ABR6NLL1_9SPHN|nr:hypothetical protein [Sphingobium lignivorans]MBB5987413.1 hypothetical protein [Sphingobium lignivorans]